MTLSWQTLCIFACGLRRQEEVMWAARYPPARCPAQCSARSGLTRRASARGPRGGRHHLDARRIHITFCAGKYPYEKVCPRKLERCIWWRHGGEAGGLLWCRKRKGGDGGCSPQGGVTFRADPINTTVFSFKGVPISGYVFQQCRAVAYRRWESAP